MAGVCVGIGDVFGFVPWGTWRKMKEIYGHKYMTAADLEAFRVKFNGHCLFLDNEDGEPRLINDETHMFRFMRIKTKGEAHEHD